MKKLFLIIAVFLIAISAQAQMYMFSHQRTTVSKGGKAVFSKELDSKDTMFVDGKNIQMIINGEFVSSEIESTKIVKGNIRYTIPGMTIDIPSKREPDEITLTLSPDKDGYSYQIIYYIESIVR